MMTMMKATATSTTTMTTLALMTMMTLAVVKATVFSLSHFSKISQSTDARSEALSTGDACGIEAPEPHFYLLAPLRRPIDE